MLLLFLGPACSRPPGSGQAEIKVEIIGANEQTVGHAVLNETKGGVQVDVEIDRLPPGNYRYAFFDNPACEPPDFATTGAPFPERTEQGMLQNMSPALQRSIGYLTVGPDGRGSAEAVAPVVTLGSGDNSLLSDGGGALVVIEVEASGDKVACGTIGS